MAIFFALITLVGWGVADVFVTILSRRIGNFKAYFWTMVLSLILTTLYIPFAGPVNDYAAFFVALVLGVFLTFGSLLYFRSLEVGNAAICGTIGGLFALPVVLLAIIFFGEKLGLIETIGIIFALTGMVLTVLKLRKKFSLHDMFSEKGVDLAYIAMICWGIYYTFIRIPVKEIGWFWSLYPSNFLIFFLIILRKIDKGSIKALRGSNTFLLILINALLITVSEFAYNAGINIGYSSVVAPIAGCYPVLFVVLARIIFKEKLANQQKLGIVLSLMGIILLAVG